MKDRIARWARDKEWVELRDVFDLPTFFYLGNFLAADDLGNLVVRLGPEGETEALAIPGAEPWRAGPPGSARIYVRLSSESVSEDEVLHAWLDRAVAYVSTLPAKERLVTKKVAIPDFLKQ